MAKYSHIFNRHFICQECQESSHKIKSTKYESENGT
jgi:hypothetical protein